MSACLKMNFSILSKLVYLGIFEYVVTVSDSLSTCCELLVEGAVDILLCYSHRTVAPMIDETAFVRKDLVRGFALGRVA